MGKEVSRFIRERIDQITEDADDLRLIAPDMANNFGTWSALKLILLSSTVNMYTNIQKGGEYFENIVYIDALAGSGISACDDRNRNFLGSPLAAVKAAEHPFKKMYFIEQDENRANALKERLSYAFSAKGYTQPEDGWEVINRNANDVFPELEDKLWKIYRENGDVNYLCFIDNERADVSWNSLSHILPKPFGDLLINVPVAQTLSRNPHNPEVINKFCGTDLTREDIPENNTRRFIRETYMRQLEENDRPVQVNTQITAEVGSFYYDMVYATRETSGGSEYVKYIKYVKDFIENVHSGDVDHILDIIDGDQRSLSEYIPINDDIETDSKEHSHTRKQQNQTGLEQFTGNDGSQ